VIHDPTMLRTYLITRLSVPNSLFGLLLNASVSDEMRMGLSDTLRQILTSILDPDTMQVDKDAFLDHFYARQVGKLVGTLTRKVKHHANYVAGDSPQYQAIELLSVCIYAHREDYRARKCLLNQSVMSKVVGLLKLKGHANVMCAVVRFIRKCIALKDEDITRRIISKKVLDPIMEIFLANGARYNLLNSSVIELVDFITSNQCMNSLKIYLKNSQFQAALAQIDYVPTFRGLRLDDKDLDDRGSADGGGDEDDGTSEYNYFNEDSDEEDGKKEGEGRTPEEEAEFLEKTQLYRSKRKSDDDVDLVGLVGIRANQGTSKKPKPRNNSKAINLDISNKDHKKRRIT